MKTKTTADIRKADELTGSFILNKMKQGRDQVIKQKFVVIEVPVGCSDEVALMEAHGLIEDELGRGYE